MPDDQRQGVEQVAFLEKQFMVIRAYLLRDHAGIAKLAGVALVFLVIANRKSLDRLPVSFGEQGRVRAGVDASREKNADGYVADLAELNRSAQFAQDAFGNLCLGRFRQWLGVVPNIPISRFLNAAVFVDSQPCARGKLLEAGKEGVRRRRRIKYKIIIKG